MSLDALIAELKDKALDSAQIDVMRDAMSQGVMGPAARNVADILCNHSAMLSVGDAIAEASSLNGLIDNLGSCVKDVFGATHAHIYIYDSVQNDLFTRDHLAPGIVNARRVSLDDGAIGACYRDVKALELEDGSLVAPVQRGNAGVLGVVEIGKPAAGRYTSDEMNRLSLVARQIATGLDHALISARVEQIRSEELQFLQLSASIAQERDIEVLLRRIVKASADLLGAERATMFVHDPETGELWSRILDGETSDLREIRIDAHTGIAGAVFQTGEVLTINDCYEDQRFNSSIDEISGYRTHNMVSAPIVSRDSTRLGVVQVLNRRNNQFDIMAEQRLQAFAAHIAVALENARLFAGME